jgi:class 3 adenylate cyclase
MSEQRRLAAIVSADVVGYSRLMGRDESGTLAALKALRRDVIDPRIARHNGRIVKTTGDGLLLEFASVVDAVRCMMEVQGALAAHGAMTPRIAASSCASASISATSSAKATTSSATGSISRLACRRRRHRAVSAYRAVCTRTSATGSTHASPMAASGR